MGPGATVGVHGPSARIASPGPGHGGIVAPIARSGSSPSARNWNVVPSGMSMLTPGPDVDGQLLAAGRAPHLTAAGEEEPHLLDRAVADGHRDLARAEFEVGHPAAAHAEQHAHVGAVGRDDVGIGRESHRLHRRRMIDAAMAQLADEIVGREGELRSFEAALSELERGRPVALELEGEPGIGKTRLLAELGRIADERGFLVLTGSASELEVELPFWVFVDALDEYVRRSAATLASDELALVLPPPGAAAARDDAAGRASPRAPRRPRVARARWPRASRSCSRSTTCTGPTPARSSCSARCCGGRRAGRC